MSLTRSDAKSLRISALTMRNELCRCCQGLVANRAQFFRDVPSRPFYRCNRDGAEVSQGLIDNW